MKNALFAAVIAAIIPVSANAADLAYKSAPMAQSAYNWTGFYIGANAGGGFQNTTVEDKACNLSCSSLTWARSMLLPDHGP
jgi:opacity protein-like surface antigen